MNIVKRIFAQRPLPMLWIATVFSQSAVALPNIESCAPMMQCEPGLGKLDDTERQLVQKLLSVVKPGATETQITEQFARAPFDKNPPMAAWGMPPGTTTYKALWSTAELPARSAGPHFDVLFINSHAMMFTWYAASMRKIVRVQIAE